MLQNLATKSILLQKTAKWRVSIRLRTLFQSSHSKSRSHFQLNSRFISNDLRCKVRIIIIFRDYTSLAKLYRSPVCLGNSVLYFLEIIKHEAMLRENIWPSKRDILQSCLWLPFKVKVNHCDSSEGSFLKSWWTWRRQICPKNLQNPP